MILRRVNEFVYFIIGLQWVGLVLQILSKRKKAEEVRLNDEILVKLLKSFSSSVISEIKG